MFGVWFTTLEDGWRFEFEDEVFSRVTNNCQNGPFEDYSRTFLGVSQRSLRNKLESNSFYRFRSRHSPKLKKNVKIGPQISADSCRIFSLCSERRPFKLYKKMNRHAMGGRDGAYFWGTEIFSFYSRRFSASFYREVVGHAFRGDRTRREIFRVRAKMSRERESGAGEFFCFFCWSTFPRMHRKCHMEMEKRPREKFA